MFALKFNQSGREVQRAFSGDSVTIGRRSGNDLQIMDEEISKEHARIEARRKGYVLVDLESSNGTFVNGEQITKRRLADGDIIALGSVELVFVERTVGDLSAEVEETADEMDKGVGYVTMMARLTGDQRKRDLEAAKGKASVHDTVSLERMFVDMGWSEAEAKRMAEQSKGRPVEDIEEGVIDKVTRPKDNELLLTCTKMFPDLEVGQMVRYRGEDCLLIEIDREGSFWTYRLKRT